MAEINDSNTAVTTNLYYDDDSTATPGTDCFFFHPAQESELYVVEIEVFWGFGNATLMEDYETYTITCTTNGDALGTLGNKKIDDNRIVITDGLVHTLGAEYVGSSTLTLKNVLGEDINATKVSMGKKIYLDLSITGGSEQGLTPYDCYARNSDSSKSYKILNAGCGDGIVFKKSAGFTVSGTTAKSPYFKVFKLIETDSANTAVKYSCSFTTCNNTCDGSSCSLSFRSKRSIDQDEPMMMADSEKYRIELPTKSDQSQRGKERKDDDTKEHDLSSVALFCVALLAILSLIFSLYSCIQERSLSQRECVPECPQSEMCPCPEYPRRV
ncbi:vitelline envelope sperm lysin receptor-like isoform X2 [Mytilus trossulus]